MPRLDVYANSELILQMKVKAEPICIGRGGECDISLIDSIVSRRHAVIRPVSGGWEILSEGRNGTRLNTSVLQGPAPLNFGDRIYIGDHALIFQSDDAPILKRAHIGMSTDTMPAMHPDAEETKIHRLVGNAGSTIDMDAPRG